MILDNENHDHHHLQHLDFTFCALPSEPVECHARKQLKMDYVVSAGHTRKQKAKQNRHTTHLSMNINSDTICLGLGAVSTAL